MICHSISEYLQAKVRWDNTLKRISPDGNSYVFVNGNWITEKEYLANNSKPVYKPTPRENSDGTALEGDVITSGGNR